MSRRTRSSELLVGALLIASCAAGCSSGSVSSVSPTASAVAAGPQPGTSGPGPGPSQSACDKLQFDVSDVQEAYTNLLQNIPAGTLDYQPKDIAAVAAADGVAAATASAGGFPKVVAAFMSLTTVVSARSTLAVLQTTSTAAVQDYENACIDLTGGFGTGG